MRECVALVVDGCSYSFEQLLDSAQQLATELRERGVRRGDRVAVYLDNSWNCVVSIYGTWIAGAVLVLINPQTKPHKLTFMLRDCGARALITDEQLKSTLCEVLRSLEDPPFLICGPTYESGSLRRSGTSLAMHPPHALTSTIPLDLAAIIYTSGSTDEPKGVMQTHQAMMFTCGSLIEYLRLSANDRILCFLPFSFDYGLYQLLMSVALGARLVVERSFAYLGQICERIRQEGITVFPGVPTVFATIIAAHKRSSLRFPSVTRVTNTAAALADEFVPSLREIFPNALLYKMYGLTECKRVSFLEPELVEAKPGSVGKAIPGTEVELLSPDGKPVPAGEIGILYVRGPHVMAGYWNRPELSDQMLKPGKLPGERLLCTHDLFRMDEAGFLYFVSRTDDMIKTRGEKISPAEVESALYRIPGVREVAALGIPDALLGEAVCACVVADSGTAFTEQDLRARSAVLLEPYAVPRRIVLCEQLPRTANGKIDKQQLRNAILGPKDSARQSLIRTEREEDHT